MIIKSNGLNLKITEGMQLAISSKLDSLRKFLDDESEVSVKVTQKKLEVKIVIMVVYNGKLIKVTERDSDFYVALDKVSDTLKAQIKKQHTIKVKRETDQSKTIRTLFNDEIEEEVDEPHITKRKKIELQPLTEDEAIQEMESLGHNSFVFLNVDSAGCVSMIYKKNDGKYGILEDLN